MIIYFFDSPLSVEGNAQYKIKSTKFPHKAELNRFNKKNKVKSFAAQSTLSVAVSPLISWEQY